MDEQPKREFVVSVTQFFKVFQQEILSMLPENKNPDLSPLLFRILLEIHLDGSTTSSILSKRLLVSIPNTSRNIHQLSEGGYIFKKQDETDKRVWHLRLTDKGRLLVEESFRESDQNLYRKLEALSTAEIEEMSASFLRLRDLIVRTSSRPR